MPANTSPIFSVTGHIEGALVVTAAATVYDISGTIGTDIYKLFTAGANGSWVDHLVCKYVGTGTTTSVAALLKVWRSTVGSGTPVLGTEALMIGEVPLPATGALSTTTPAYVIDLPLQFAMPSGTYLLGKITVSQPANYGWCVTTFGGDY